MFPGVSADGLLVVPTCQVRETRGTCEPAATRERRANDAMER